MDQMRYRMDDGGIALVEIDTPGPVNTIGARFITELGRCCEAARAGGARGMILTSAKRASFLDGANLVEIARDPSPADLRHLVLRLQETYADLARSPFPVVAVLEGQTALGGGFELVLWSCDQVVATAGARMGLPEVNVGLFPAAGGTETLRRLVGLDRMLDIVLKGRILPAESFVPAGLVTTAAPGGAIEAARAWIDSHGGAVNRNYDPGWKEPGALEPAAVTALLGRVRAEAAPCPERPWIAAALDSIEEGLGLALEDAAARAAERFAPLIIHPNVRNKIDLFLLTTSVAPRLARVDPGLARRTDRVAVIGAGLMGQGIAQVCADAGIEVLLLDVDEDRARDGKERIARSVEPLVVKGRWSPERRDRLLSLVTPTADRSRLAAVPLAIETVFEDLDLKRRVLADAQQESPEIVFASNTSTLPMAEISSASPHPEQVVGMHYFSPVPLMPLLEVVEGPATSAAALATAVTSGRGQKKTCIVVGDGPGFYTSRTFGAFVLTGFHLVEMGLAPWDVDRIAIESGFPQGPLHVYGTAGGNVIFHAASAMAERMPEIISVPRTLARMHAAGYVGAGRPCFYSSGLVPDESALEHVVPAPSLPRPGREDVRDMLLLSMVNQAFLCLESGVLRDYHSMDLGAVLGVGFPDCWHGPARYTSQRGVRATAARIREIHDRWGIGLFAPSREFARIAACGLDRGLV